LVNRHFVDGQFTDTLPIENLADILLTRKSLLCNTDRLFVGKMVFDKMAWSPGSTSKADWATIESQLADHISDISKTMLVSPLCLLLFLFNSFV